MNDPSHQNGAGPRMTLAWNRPSVSKSKIQAGSRALQARTSAAGAVHAPTGRPLARRMTPISKATLANHPTFPATRPAQPVSNSQ